MLSDNDCCPLITDGCLTQEKNFSYDEKRKDRLNATSLNMTALKPSLQSCRFIVPGNYYLGPY